MSSRMLTALLLLWATCCQAAVAMPTEEASSTPETIQPTPNYSTSTTERFTDKLTCFDDHPSLHHGYYEVMEESHMIRPHCHPGFLLVGGEDLVCNETAKKFSGRESKCEDIDECSSTVDDDAINDDVANSALSEKGDDDDDDVDYVTRNCHQEATCINTFGSYKCVCRDGYHGNGFDCDRKSEEKCSVPDPPSFGVLYPINPLNVRILCHPDYSIHGRSIIKCDKGQWEPLPRCIPGWKSCGDPGVPTNGFRKGNRYHEGASVRFYCRHGYQIQGSRLRICMEPDLKWTGSQPICIEEVSNKERVADGGDIAQPKILHREKRI